MLISTHVMCWRRANDLPFARRLGVPYEDFVLNIQPDDYVQLNAKVQHILDSPKQLRRMQVTDALTFRPCPSLPLKDCASMKHYRLG